MNYGMRFVTLYRRQGSRPSPWKRNAKKQNGCEINSLQIAVKRREEKSKGEKERCTHLNAEFQRIARRGEKAFLSDQWIVSTFPFITASLELSFAISTKIKLLQKSNKYLLK